MSIGEKFEVIADEVYANGRQDEWSDFWDGFQNKGKYLSGLSYAFAYDVWTDAHYNPKYTITTYFGGGKYLGAAHFMFYSTYITDTKVDIDLRDNKSESVFRSAYIKIIRKVIVSEKTTYSNWFRGASALENIAFEGVIGNDIDFSSCTLLNKASIVNIFEHLSTTTSGKTLTLNKTAVNNAFGIDIDDGNTYTEEWRSVYMPITNWTLDFI